MVIDSARARFAKKGMKAWKKVKDHRASTISEKLTTLTLK